MRIVNIINFIRGCEPRDPNVDLFGTVKEEIALNKRYGFDNTFLIQHDAMVQSEYTDLLNREKDEQMELGVWIEIGQPLVESVGIDWRGRFPWDWHVDPGFLPSYTKEQRVELIDEIFRVFKEKFGEFPRVVGSWLIDSFSMDYMAKTYDIDAFCICREQFGTDGYTLWGGYYNGAYYPSKNHMLTPAVSEQNKIDVPCFRMLGIDPADAYDEAKERNPIVRSVCCTLEPVWESGANEQWVKWYFENFCECEDLGFSYTQTGQENSFDWCNFGDALKMQFDLIDRLQKDGKLQVKKFGDTGRAFKKAFPDTPATAYSSMNYAGENDCRSVWYSSAFYRANLFSEDGKISIRDIHLFDENLLDRYLDSPAVGATADYDTLPVVSGLWDDERAARGLCFDRAGSITDLEKQGDTLVAKLELEGKYKADIAFEKNGISVKSEVPLTLTLNCDINLATSLKGVEGNTVNFVKDTILYSLQVTVGTVEFKDTVVFQTDDSGKLTVKFECENIK